MIPNTGDSVEIETAAAAWFAKRESGNWSAADEAQLQAWLESSTARRVAFIRIITAWERSGRLSALGAGVPPGAIPPRDVWRFAPVLNVKDAVGSTSDSPERAGSPRFRSLRLPAIAALFLIAIAGGTAWYVLTERAHSYRTQIGAITTVPLADGSQLTLNTDSLIRIDLDSSSRRIILDRGEVFFDVSKDAARPFIVEVADKRVIAVGTQFSVRRDHDDIRVLVTEGRVRIERRGVAQSSAETQIAAGSEARTEKTAVFIDRPEPTQVEQLLSWRTGYLLFRDTPLSDAVADFNRYSTRKIVIDDPAIAGIRIGGNFRSGDSDAFIWLLQNGFPINVEQRSDRIILTKR
jgi:transmembrane sensor